MKNATLRGKLYAGNPRVWFDEGEVALEKLRHGSLLYRRKTRDLTGVAVAFLLSLGLTASSAPITLDFSKSVGEAPLVYGLARPPSPAFDRWTRGDDLRKANIPYLYMHNVGGAYGSGAFVDISNLFPKFDADADDPASYDFMVTDNLMQCMIRNKLAPIFRLGESEEEMASVRRYRTFPPKDAAKWACICEHVIRHYNEGWDNGFKYDIDYWPIWHAPDRSTCWAGTMDEFVDFYAVAARHLKARFPRLKIGGAGLAGPVDGFVAAVKARGLPLDFLSFEAAGDAAAVARRVREVKAALAAAGLSRVELLPIVQPAAKPGTMRSAAEIAANLAMLANEGVKTAVTGERDCAAHHFSPFLDPLTGKWRPAFQSLVAFDRLYAYRERAAFENGAAAEGLVVTAVRDPFGGGAAMVVNLSGEERTLDLRAPGWSVVGAASFDEATDYHEMPLPKTIAPDRVVVVRFLKDDAERPVPLERADGFTIGFNEVTGPVKPVNGVGQAPMVGWDFSMFRYLKEADIPLSRFHDTGGSLGRSVFADVSNIFRDFDADENDPKNYDFAFTDLLVDELRKNGVKIYYRLGETIETRSFFRRYRTYPPKDYAKWARICEHIVRHYENDIAYLEIWNEPDGTEKPMYNGLWKGTFAEFLELYGVASKHLKKCFPHIKVGGYASTGFGGAFAGQPSDRQRYLMKCFFEFLDFCQAKRCPVDFFSFHCYGDGDAIDPIQRFVRKHLDAAGFPHAEIHNTEWKAGWGVKDFDHQAALTAGTLIAMQNGPMDVATIYDGRCGAGDYSPLFNPSTLAPHKAYYVFRMFAELRRDGRAVKTAADATAKLRLAASTDGHGRGHALVSNSSWKSVPLKLNAPGWKVTGCRALDKTHDDTEIPLPTTLAANQVLLLTLEKDK